MVKESDILPLVDKSVTVRCKDGQVISGLVVYDWQPDVDDDVPEAVLLSAPGSNAIMEVRADEIESIAAA